METNTTFNGIILERGKPYIVKHSAGNKNVRRIFRGIEKRFDTITCLVFTSKVKKGVFAELDIVKDAQGKETGVVFWKWKNTSSIPSQEISIPLYDIKSITT